MRNTPKDIVGSGSGVAGEAQKAANAAEHKASSAIKERDEKIKKI